MVDFFAKKHFPDVTPDTYLRQTAADIIDILQDNNHNIPTLMYGDNTTNAFIGIAQILKQIILLPFPKKTTHLQKTPQKKQGC